MAVLPEVPSRFKPKGVIEDPRKEEDRRTGGQVQKSGITDCEFFGWEEEKALMSLIIQGCGWSGMGVGRQCGGGADRQRAQACGGERTELRVERDKRIKRSQVSFGKKWELRGPG